MALVTEHAHPYAHDIVRRAQRRISNDFRLRTVGDIADAVGVAKRTLQRAFHDNLGVGVASFVRMTRLAAVRAELIHSDSTATSVTEIATKYGFTEFGRFAVRYKSCFGESPSRTLRRTFMG